MARSAVEHDERMVVGVGFGKLVKEALQASCVHPGQVKAEALSLPSWARAPHREVGPLVGAPDDVGWTKALRTVAPPVPVDQAKTSFVKSQHLQGLVGF